MRVRHSRARNSNVLATSLRNSFEISLFDLDGDGKLDVIGNEIAAAKFGVLLGTAD